MWRTSQLLAGAGPHWESDREPVNRVERRPKLCPLRAYKGIKGTDHTKPVTHVWVECVRLEKHMSPYEVYGHLTGERRRGAEAPDQRDLPKGELECIATWRRE